MQKTSKAVLVLILSMCIAMLGNSFVHYLSYKYSAQTILFYKSLCALIFLFYVHPILFKIEKKVLKSYFKLNLLRAFVGTFGVLLWISSIQHIPLQEASTLGLTSSFFSAIGGYIFLKETPTAKKNISLLIGFMGASIILHPHFKDNTWFYLLPLGSAFCFGISGTLTRFLVQNQEEYITSFYLFSVMLMISLIIGFSLPHSIMDGLILIFIGVCYGAAQLLYVHSYKLAEASYLANFKFLKIPLSSFFGIIFFLEWPTFYTIIGTLIMILGLIFLSYKLNRKRHSKL